MSSDGKFEEWARKWRQKELHEQTESLKMISQSSKSGSSDLERLFSGRSTFESPLSTVSTSQKKCSTAFLLSTLQSP